WVSQAENVSIIKACIDQGILQAKGTLYFYGFDELEPAVNAVIDAFAEHENGKSVYLDFGKTDNVSKSRAYTDKDAEIEAALQWLVGASRANPGESYCVVAPDIADDRAQIERVCKRLVQPESYSHPGLNTWRDEINVSAGSPLGSFGIVADALLLLNMLAKPILRDEWGTLLRSPYWEVSAQRFSSCSLFADKLVEAKSEKLSVSVVEERYRTLLERSGRGAGGEEGKKGDGNDPLMSALQIAGKTNVAGNKRFSEWAAIIPEILQSLGWSGRRSLSSQDYQLKEKFFEQLRMLALFDEVVGEVPFFHVIRHLKQALNEAMFQIKTEQASMQVLGILEASGLHFDGIWVMSSDDQHWPASPAPNPFICQHLQRSKGMPNASAEKELAYASFILSAFTKTTSSTIFSWHQLEGDNEFNISPLLTVYTVDEGQHEQCLKNGDDEIPPILGGPWLTINDPVTELFDNKGRALPEGSKVKGGASIIKAQALCPFKAFAVYRLGAKTVEEVEDGLSPAERGELLHLCLEGFWRDCESSEQLHALLNKPDVLQTQISSNVNAAVELFCEQAPGLNEAFLVLEKKRLEKLVLYWLVNVEAKRTPFVISSLEQSETLTVNNVEVTVKADRIDLVDGQHTVIVDYKTGQKSRSAWKGDRPDDPQLPLYAIKHRDDVDGVVFAVVKQGGSGIKGEMDEAVSLIEGRSTTSIGKIEDWPAHVDNWDRVITTLADDFSAGVAIVDPKNKSSCDYCELTTFCRRKEL
ncbi:MAG: PD-(D/E)XK nuclease family protein, partial [Pseudomonadales bacterium]|nr:PD-(D/E)XK nuclease family protein [Pseudomonadales bacterium]